MTLETAWYYGTVSTVWTQKTGARTYMRTELDSPVDIEDSTTQNEEHYESQFEITDILAFFDVFAWDSLFVKTGSTIRTDVK